MTSTTPLPERLRETLAAFDRPASASVPLTTNEVAEATDCARRTAYNRLDALVERGAVASKKVGARGRVWWRTDAGTETPPDTGAGTASETGADTETGTRGSTDNVRVSSADATDVTGRDEALEFRSLVAAVDEYAIFMLDPDGNVVTWNEGARLIKGYRREEIVGEPYASFYTDEDVSDGVPARNLEQAAAEGSVDLTGWRVRKDGSRFWANATLTAVRDDDGSLRGYVKVTRDMTDHREYETRLRRQRNLVQQVVENSTAGMVLLSGTGVAEEANDQARELLGVDPATVPVSEWPLVDAEGETLTEEENPVTQVFETGNRVDDREMRVETPEGADEQWVAITVAPVSADRTVDRVVVTLYDVTPLKSRERRLERQHAGLRRALDEAFERIDDAVFALDDAWRVTYLNERAERLFDRPKADVVGQSLWETFPGAVGSTFHTEYERAMLTQETVSFEEYYPPVGKWFEVRAYPSETGLSVHMRDVTARKEREDELERYETIVETIDDGVYAVDEDARFVLVNDALCEMTGYDRADLVGAHASTIHDDEVTPQAAELAAAVDAGDRDAAAIELDVHRADGTTVPAESRLAPVRIGDSRGRCGVVRDVTERVERERELERQIRQQEVVADLGQRALGGDDLDALMAETAERVADTLDVDYSKVLDLDRDAAELLLRQGVGWDDGIVGSATVSAVEDASQAAYTLQTDEPVVVTDLATESRFSGPDLLTDHDVRSGISTVIGPVDDPWGILGTHDTEQREFADYDVDFVQSVANILATAINRRRNEAELRRRGEQLAALNDLNEVVHEIVEAVIDQSTREEIERVVCERLAAAESYRFAWIGDVDAHSQTVRPRTEAGVEGYLDDVTISVDPEDPRARGATGRAVRTGEIQVTRDVLDNPDYEPWREHVREYGFRSSAAIPITHEGTLYGVLNVYASRPEAFEDDEQSVVGQLGEVMGHAIASVERKRALMSDEVLAVEYRIEDLFDRLGAPTIEGRITLERVVPLGDEEYLVYGTAPADAADSVSELTDAVPTWTDATILTDGPNRVRFELQLSGSPVLSAVASRGGYVDRAAVEDGDYWMVVHLPPGVEARRVSEVVRETYPGAEFVSQRQLSRDMEHARSLTRVLREELTDRQRTVLEAAYFSGFFEWPRESDGGDVADAIGIAPATFHQHLRHAQRKLLDATFVDGGSAHE